MKVMIESTRNSTKKEMLGNIYALIKFFGVCASKAESLVYEADWFDCSVEIDRILMTIPTESLEDQFDAASEYLSKHDTEIKLKIV